MGARVYEWTICALLHHRTTVLEWFLAMEALLCGLWVLKPGAAFGAPTLLTYLPESLTGAVFTAHGLLAVLALARVRPGKPRGLRNLDLCRRSALASAALWTMVLASYLFAGPGSTLVIPLLAGFVISSLWVYFRLFLLFGPGH